MHRHCPRSQCGPAASQARLLAAVALLGLLALPVAMPLTAAAAIEEQLGTGMPLVLKDGRIANVTVHTVPFVTGADAVDAATAASLEATFRPLATDCFLTAQAIGHVAPGVARDGDTLAAHRLARARADGIQALLAAFGMPQPAVASVWDWQFLVQESQVTLWVFSLTVGDDCDGTPLPLAGASVAAASKAPAEPAPLTAEAATPAAAESAPIAAIPPADFSAAQGGSPPSPLIVSALEEPAAEPTGAPATGSAEGAAAPALETPARSELRHETVRIPPLEETAARPVPPVQDPLATAAVAPAQPARAAPASAADGGEQALPAAHMQLAAIGAGTVPSGAQNGAPALVITFDVNSSYFPAGAGRQLRALLDSLPEATAVQIELATTVGTGDVRGVSGEEAKRYNAWMAERRAQRVAEWLEANVRGRSITIDERLVENDSSREVRLFISASR